MDNLELWNKVKQPPKSALKKITGGRLSGMTDISPQWRLLALTEQFGSCGVGWKYTVDKLWQTDGPEGQVFAFALINLSTKQNGEWSEPIPGIGGSMLVTKEKAGLHVSDEGYKMAVTDALSVACKALGIAADIYMGLWDGSKYKDAPEPKKQDKNPEATPRQILYNMMKEKGLSKEDMKEFSDFVGAKADKELKDFIAGFDAQHEAWQKSLNPEKAEEEGWSNKVGGLKAFECPRSPDKEMVTEEDCRMCKEKDCPNYNPESADIPF